MGRDARADPNRAVGRELTALNLSPAAIVANTASGRELSVLNLAPAAIATNSAVGRELTTLNWMPAAITLNTASGREYSLQNDMGALIPPNAAVGREMTGYLAPYTFSEIAEALRYAAGLSKANADRTLRLNVVITPPSATVVDVLDAVRVSVLERAAPPE